MSVPSEKRKLGSLLFFLAVLVFIIYPCTSASGQDTLTRNYDLSKQKDINDVVRQIFKKGPAEKRPHNKPSTTLLPILGYNPSFGFNIGVNLMAGKQFGLPSNTIYSIFNLSASYSTKNILTFRARHNMFTPGNKWNWQGDWQLSKMGIVDWGIGTGQGRVITGFNFNDMPTKNGDSSFPIKYQFIRLFEKAYRRIAGDFYIGAGVDFDIYTDINDKKQTEGLSTPHQRYSRRNDFDSNSYSANGFILAFQYNTREHPVRAYRGIYADVNIRFNETWMASTKHAVQLMYDFREYISLSKRNPAHVLAFWQWASYKLSGKIPYLEMPGTAHDTYMRSGRGYTFGRFKGPSYACFETEYRFPVTRNSLISGVAFFNFQTASDDLYKKVFEYWEPAAGLGLRILFDKNSRSALCLDFAMGKYGAAGIFCGLNEVF